MQRGETDRSKWFNNDAGSPQLVAMVLGDVHRSEGVVEDEHSDAGFGAFTQDLAERVGHTTRGAVIQLQSDRPLCRPQVFPQARIGAVTVQHHLDMVAGARAMRRWPSLP